MCEVELEREADRHSEDGIPDIVARMPTNGFTTDSLLDINNNESDDDNTKMSSALADVEDCTSTTLREDDEVCCDTGNTLSLTKDSSSCSSACSASTSTSRDGRDSGDMSNGSTTSDTNDQAADDNGDASASATPPAMTLPLNEIPLCGRDVELSQLDALFHSCCIRIQQEQPPPRTYPISVTPSAPATAAASAAVAVARLSSSAGVVNPVAARESISATLATPISSNRKKQIKPSNDSNDLRSSMKKRMSWNPQSKTASSSPSLAPSQPGHRRQYTSDDIDNHHDDDDTDDDGSYYNRINGSTAAKPQPPPPPILSSSPSAGSTSCCSAFVSIKGAAGVGKSTLIHSRQQLWSTKYGALVVSGNFEFQKSTKPYAAIVTALEELIQLWLKSEEEQDTTPSTPSEQTNDHQSNKKSADKKEELEESAQPQLQEEQQSLSPTTTKRRSDRIEQLRQIVHEIGIQVLGPILPSLISLVNTDNGRDNVANGDRRSGDTNRNVGDENGTTDDTVETGYDSDDEINSANNGVTGSAATVASAGAKSAASAGTASSARTAGGRSTNSHDMQSGNNLDRLKAALWKLLSFLCKPSRPVVLLLDDIQWADRGSLEILKMLALSNVQGLFLIVAYRDEDVHELHPVSLILLDACKQQQQQQQLRKSTTVSTVSSSSSSILSHAQEISLRALDVLAVNEIVSIVTNRKDFHRVGGGRGGFGRRSQLASLKMRQETASIGGIINEYGTYDSLDDNSKKKTWELSQIVHNLSGGSPFFVVQLLKLLADEGLLYYDKKNDRWDWDEISVETKIRGSLLNESDSVADIVAGSMRRLPRKTHETLMVASCLGVDVPVHVLGEFFDFKKAKTAKKCNSKSCAKSSKNLCGDGLVGNDHIARMDTDENATRSCCICCPRCLDMDQKDLMEALDDAVESGVLRRLDKSGQTYKWSHDKLTDAAYSLIPPSDRQSLHWRLGKLLLKMSTDHPTEEWMIYMAAYQFNKAQRCFSDDITSADLAKLNLRAAKLSITKSAFYPAVDLLRAGVRHLQECPSTKKWRDHYTVCVELFNTLAEMEYLTGNHEACLDAVREVVHNATSLEDKFRAQCRLLDCVSSGKSRDYAKSIKMSMDILSSYGVKLPTKKSYSRWLLFLEAQRLKRALPNGRFESLLIMPKMTDPTTTQITKLLADHLALYALNSGEMMTVRLASMHVIRLSAKYGINTNTCVAVQFYALCEMLTGNFKEAFRISTLAVSLCSRFNESPGSQHAKIKGSANSSILAIMRPFHENLEGCIEAYRVGLRTGDMEFSSLSAMFYSLCYLCIGLPLAPLEPDLISFGQEATLFGRPLSIVCLFGIYRQTILNLQTLPVYPTVLKGEAMDQDEILNLMDGKARSMTLRDICSFRLLLAVIYGDMNVAKEMVDTVSSFPFSDLVTFRGHLRVTYTGLAAVALGRMGDKKYATIGRSIINRVKVDVKAGAVNLYPILLMLQAEENPSKTRYDTAIKACGRSGLIQHKAYMYERAGLQLSSSQKVGEGWAEYYLSRALAMYRDWGALGKVEQMKRKHAFLAESSSGPSVTSFRSLKGRSRHEKKFADQIKRFNIGGGPALTSSSAQQTTTAASFSTATAFISTASHSMFTTTTTTTRSLPENSAPVMFRESISQELHL